MQSIYAMHQKGSDALEKEEKFLLESIDAIQDLYLIMVSSLIEICKKEIIFLQKSSQKHLATAQERNPNEKFISNAVFKILTESESLSQALKNRKINNWTLNDDYILLLLTDIKNSKLYEKYMHNTTNSFDEDKEFIVDLFSDVIVTNEKLYDYLEDNKLTWIDDIPLVNTHIIKHYHEYCIFLSNSNANTRTYMYYEILTYTYTL
jgi:N utilization substance protein B